MSPSAISPTQNILFETQGDLTRLLESQQCRLQLEAIGRQNQSIGRDHRLLVDFQRDIVEFMILKIVFLPVLNEKMTEK